MKKFIKQNIILSMIISIAIIIGSLTLILTSGVGMQWIEEGVENLTKGELIALLLLL